MYHLATPTFILTCCCHSRLVAADTSEDSDDNDLKNEIENNFFYLTCSINWSIIIITYKSFPLFFGGGARFDECILWLSFAQQKQNKVNQGSMLWSQFSAILGETIGVFLKNQCYDQIFE
jgi:hypothetical protein